MIHTFRGPRQILFGEGVASAVPRLCAQNGTRILVVTDKGVAAQRPVEELLATLRSSGLQVTVFDETHADLPLSDVEAAVKVAIDVKADATLAIGGGSVMDLAKVVGLIRVHGGSPRDYYGECVVPGPTMPLIAVPTTSGTGSEVTPVSVLSDPDRELKIGISSTYLIPDFAVVDPVLTWSCPPTITAHSGIDAFCHAVESFTARQRPHGPDALTETIFLGRNDITDEFALRAVRLMARSLSRSVHDGSDREARADMSSAATLAGLAFAHAGTACPHALQYAVGAATHTSHGLGVGLLLPYALRSIRDVAVDRLAILAHTVGLNASLGDPEDAADSFIDWVEVLLRDIGIPRSLADIGVKETDIPLLAEKSASVTRLLANHPGDTDVNSLTQILRAAWVG